MQAFGDGGEAGADHVEVEGGQLAAAGIDALALVVAKDRAAHAGRVRDDEGLEDRPKWHAADLRQGAGGVDPGHDAGDDGAVSAPSAPVAWRARDDGDADDDHVRRFLDICLVEARRYGDDDDIWVRELVQNARDAGARAIRFSIDNGVVVVDDDGAGMSRAVINAQLLRLFSSTKGAAVGQAAGCFGVGFWSVLRASPRQIVVDSHDGAAACGVLVDVAGAAVVERDGDARDARRRRGTTIRLFGTALGQDPRGVERLRAALIQHASTVAGVASRAPPALVLSTSHGDVRLNATLSLRGVDGVLVATDIVGRGFRGVVGLTNRPRVELFHHGLRVVQATSLAAVVPTLQSPPRRGLGLAVRVDIDGLRVLVDRRTVVEDDTVRAVVAACHAAAARLERRVLDGAAPLPLLWRAVDVLKRHGVGRGVVTALAALVVGVLLGCVVVAVAFPEVGQRLRPGTAVAPQSLADAVDRLGAPRIDPRGADLRGVDLLTRRVVDDNLTLQVLALPDDAQGLGARPVRSQPLVEVVATGPPVASARFMASGPTVLPSSQALWPIEVLVDDVAVPITRTADGLPLLVLARGVTHTVDVAFGLQAGPPPDRDPAPLIRAVPALIPLAALARGRTHIDGISAIASAVRQRVRYSVDDVDARRFAADPRPLIDKALALGVGDCDVINTVLVRALQQAGYEARLAVGVIVRDDVVAAALHAWVEVAGDVQDGWLVVDASPPDAVPVPGRAPAAVAGPATPFQLAAPTAKAPPPLPTTTTTTTTTSTKTSTTWAPPLVSARPRHALIVGGFVVAAVLVIAVVVLVRSRRRRGHAATVDDAAVTALLVAGLHSGAAESLGLWRRRVLPTSHGAIDLREARALAHRGQLAAGRRPAWVHGDVRVVDDADPRVVGLRPFLPSHPRLASIVAVSTSSPDLQVLQRRIDRDLVGVVLHVEPGASVREIVLHTIDGARHHVLVGEALLTLDKDALWDRLLDDATSLRALRSRS